MKRQGRWGSWPTSAAVSRWALLLPSRALENLPSCLTALAAGQRGDGELGARQLPLALPAWAPPLTPHAHDRDNFPLRLLWLTLHRQGGVRRHTGVTESDSAESPTPALQPPKLRGAPSLLVCRKGAAPDLPACGGAHENSCGNAREMPAHTGPANSDYCDDQR